jgi:hypothetical protein
MIRRCLALLGLLASVPPLHGGSIGIADLPPLHGKAPARIPDLAGPALVRYWQGHEFAPALRDPGLEVRLAGALTAARDRDPARFDRLRPVVGHLLRDPAYLDRALHAYVSHQARFTHYHHHLIPVLRGLALDTSDTSEQSPAPVPPYVGSPSSPVEVPGPDAVPAPKSLLLLFLGLTGCVLARGLFSRRDVVG